MAYPRTTVEVDNSGWTSLPSASKVTFSARLNEPGDCSMSVPLARTTDVPLVVLNRRALVKVDGAARHAGRIKPQSREIITKAGASRWFTFNAPGMLSEWGDATVLPPFGPDVTPSTSQRVFNWACPEIDDATWGTDWTDVAAITGIDGRPWANPDALSRRIWAASGDKVYARRRLSVTAGRIYPFFTASSGWHRQWVGGVAPVEGEKSPMPSDEFSRRSVPKFSATGDVVFGIESERLDGSTTPWLNGVVYELTSVVSGELTTSTFLSHTGLIPSTPDHDPWKVSTTPTGPTPGRIIRALLEEAQALSLLTGWTLDFDDDVDSNGNAWDAVTEVVLDVGMTLLDALTRMAETEIDVAAPSDGTRVLSAYRWRERGDFHTSPATPPKLCGERFGTVSGRNGNIVELSHEFQDAPPTKLHVVWERGSFITGTGSVMRSVAVPAKSKEGAQAIADRIIDGGDGDAVAQSVVVAVQPRNSDDTPFTHFDIGDAVACPDETGTLQSYRVQAITVETTNAAAPRYSLELSTPLAESAQRAARWLHRLDPSGLNGLTAASSTPTDLGSGITAGRLSQIRTVAFNLTGLVEVSESDPWPAQQRVRMYAFSSTLTTAGTTDTVIAIKRNGTSVHTVTFPATYTEHDGFMGGIYLVKGDVLTAAVTTAGTDAEGLVIECFATEAI